MPTTVGVTVGPEFETLERAARRAGFTPHGLRHETQSLRHRAHERLMRAFLDPEVFSGGVRIVEDEPDAAQTRLTV